VRFIVESSFLSDFSDWAVRVLELLPGMSRTQIRDVIANRPPEVAAERNRYGHRVNTRRRSHLGQAYPARIFGPYQFHSFGEPLGHCRFGQGATPTSACSEQAD
jgi:hypothetical protein